MPRGKGPFDSPSKKKRLPAAVQVSLCSEDGTIIDYEEVTHSFEVGDVVHLLLWGSATIDRRHIRIDYTDNLGYPNYEEEE